VNRHPHALPTFYHSLKNPMDVNEDNLLDPAGPGAQENQRPNLRPYLALLTAVLEDSFTFQSRCRRVMEIKGELKPRLVAQLERDREWILDNDTSYPFSFVSICLTLGIDPSAVREKYLSGGGIYGRKNSCTNRENRANSG